MQQPTEEQIEVATRSFPAVVEAIASVMEELESVEDLSKMTKREIAVNLMILTDAMTTMSMYLLGIDMNIRTLDKAMMSLIKRLDDLEYEYEDEENNEEDYTPKERNPDPYI